jgi:hypothetical protein
VIKTLLIFVFSFVLTACGAGTQSSDSIQHQQQELILAEATAQTGMPAIKNFRERRTLKTIYELRDQDGLLTFTYLVSKDSKLVLLCESHGFAISDATGYTNPEKVVRSDSVAFGTMPQAEPNGLFTPSASTANWVMCLGEAKRPYPVYVQGDIVVSPMPLVRN